MDVHQKNMLKQIMALEFSALEFNLYLDTHPDDERALSEFNTVAEELAALKRDYESRYGPLLNYGLSGPVRTWRWIDDPWPWEITF
ncbi:MAG: spore coat protein CotJB [Clostridia bacterium]|nr:spore coat protein CotJB [Clostridia bacterium]